MNGMVLCSYHRPLRNNHETSCQLPASRTFPGTEGASNARDRELDQMKLQIQAVMEQVNVLNQKMSAVFPPSPVDLPFLPEPSSQPASRGESDQPMQLGVAIEQETISPEYHGPTSSEFTFEVANQSLADLGVGSSISNSNHSSRHLSFPSIIRNPTADKTLLRSILAQDPLWTVARPDALRYINTYHNTVGAMYPAINSSSLSPKVQLLFDALDGARKRRYLGGFVGLLEMMFSCDTKIIKILLAIGMFTELGVAGTEDATKFVQSALDSSDDLLMNAEGPRGAQIFIAIVSCCFCYVDSPNADLECPLMAVSFFLPYRRRAQGQQILLSCLATMFGNGPSPSRCVDEAFPRTRGA